MHIFLNMSSFLWKGAELEPTMGSARFSGLLLELLALSHGLVVLTSRLLASAMPSLSRYYYRCSLILICGTSGRAFTLSHQAF